MDRNQLEQEALRQINLGSHEGALKAYGAILRLDPRDRRIRQKVGELLLKLGRPAEAEKHLREIAEGLVKEGNHRAAVAVLKQLVVLKADDPALQFDLAECYASSGYASDAKGHFDVAMRIWIGAGRSMDAAKCARRLAELSPGEPAMRLKVAELLEAAGDPIGAATVYQEVAEEYRRRGRPDEVGRVAEMALRLRPDDVGLLLDAAAARVEGGEHRKALVHLQLAFAQAPREARTLDLLARAFEGAGQPDKALKVLGELSRVVGDGVDPNLEADALRRALRLSPGDAELQGRLAAAEERVSRLERRLTQLAAAQPVNEVELRAVVRAEVFGRYGFYDRAEVALREGLSTQPDSLPLLAALAELEVARGRKAEAVRIAEPLVTRAGADAGAVRERIVVLGGGARAVEAPTGPAAVAPVAPAPPVAARATETAEARGDRLVGEGDFDGSLAAYREALAANPLDEGIVAKIAALRALARATPTPAPARVEEEDPFAEPEPLEDGTFSEVNPDALDELEAAPDLDEARSMVAVGLFAEALAFVGDDPSLAAAVLRAQATRGLGDSAGAVEILRDATNDAEESDPAYLDALYELSALYTQTGKARAAIRLLEEVRDLDFGYRSGEVEARLRGLQKFMK